MTDSEYLALAEAALDQLERAIESCGAEIEYERSGNVLRLEFDNGSQIIVNLQQSMHEIWVAAKAGGFHYRYRDGAWRDTRDDSELFAALSRQASAQGSQTVNLMPA